MWAIWTFVGKVMCVLFNMLSRFFIVFLSRSKSLVILWLQSPSMMILEPKKIKSDIVLTFLPSICHEVMGPDAMIFIFWMLSFKPAFSLSSFTLIKSHFGPSSFSVIKVISSAYLRLLMFLTTILIPACEPSSSAFHMMYSAYKLNKQDYNIQPWHTPFPILSQSCLVLTVASYSAYRLLRKQVRWSGILISLRIFQFVVIHRVKGFSIVNGTEIDIFLEFPCFFYDPVDVGKFISFSSAFSKFCLYIWKFSFHVLLKPSLKNVEHNLASMWNNHSCAVVWTLFGIALLWDWSENWPFPALWPLLSSLNLLAYWVQQNIIF